MGISLDDLYRTPVYTAKGRRVGRVGDVLFHPSEPRVIGFAVQRPRLLFLLDLKDRYLALDSCRPRRDEVDVTGGKESWDKAASRRLSVDWDASVVWSGMPVRAEKGTALGQVKNAEFDPETGRLLQLVLTSGAAADIAVGTRRVEPALVTGFRDGSIVVKDEVLTVETSGGAAAAAGRGAAVAKKQAGEAAVAAGKAVRTAAEYGKAAAKVAAGSETGKKTIGWLKSIRDEVVDAMGDPDDD